MVLWSWWDEKSSRHLSGNKHNDDAVYWWYSIGTDNFRTGGLVIANWHSPMFKTVYEHQRGRLPLKEEMVMTTFTAQTRSYGSFRTKSCRTPATSDQRRREKSVYHTPPEQPNGFSHRPIRNLPPRIMHHLIVRHYDRLCSKNISLMLGSQLPEKSKYAHHTRSPMIRWTNSNRDWKPWG